MVDDVKSNQAERRWHNFLYFLELCGLLQDGARQESLEKEKIKRLLQVLEEEADSQRQQDRDEASLTYEDTTESQESQSSERSHVVDIDALLEAICGVVSVEELSELERCLANEDGFTPDGRNKHKQLGVVVNKILSRIEKLKLPEGQHAKPQHPAQQLLMDSVHHAKANCEFIQGMLNNRLEPSHQQARARLHLQRAEQAFVKPTPVQFASLLSPTPRPAAHRQNIVVDERDSRRQETQSLKIRQVAQLARLFYLLERHTLSLAQQYNPKPAQQKHPRVMDFIRGPIPRARREDLEEDAYAASPTPFTMHPSARPSGGG